MKALQQTYAKWFVHVARYSPDDNLKALALALMQKKNRIITDEVGLDHDLTVGERSRFLIVDQSDGSKCYSKR